VSNCVDVTAHLYSCCALPTIGRDVCETIHWMAETGYAKTMRYADVTSK